MIGIDRRAPLIAAPETNFSYQAVFNGLYLAHPMPESLPTHVLDLPSVHSRPSAEELLKILRMLEVKDCGFGLASDEGDEDDEQEVIVSNSPQLMQWLTMLVGCGLDWIKDPDNQDEIISMASMRIAERCGRNAQPSKVREIVLEKSMEPIKIHEPSLVSDNLGLKTWGSAYVISRRLLRQPDMLKGRVLELGSGTGLFGITAAKLGSKIVLTDLEDIVPNLERNIEANDCEDNASVATLDWMHPEEFGEQKFDTVVVADPIYSPEHPRMVFNVIETFLTKNGRLIVQLPLRANFEDLRQEFYSLLDNARYHRTQFDVEEGRDEFGTIKFEFSMYTAY